MEFVRIPPGEFMMGCSMGDTECFGIEPVRLQRITQPFEIGKYEVTQEQWEAVGSPNYSQYFGADLPTTAVSGTSARQVIDNLNARNDGYRYRWPTEAEWEYAARAGTTDKYAGGVLDEIAWYNLNSGGKAHPVGQKKPNAWGLYDVLGNAGEYVGETSFCRGGDFRNDMRYVRVSCRSRENHTTAGPSACGVRIIREISAGTPSVVALHDIQLAASSIEAGTSISGNVMLNGMSAAEGTTVALESSDTAVAVVPRRVSVPAGQSAANFTVALKFVTAPRQLAVTARLGNQTMSATLAVMPAAVRHVVTISGPFNMQFVSIPPGEFMMGCSPENEPCAAFEGPRHRVRLTKPFEMGKYEVTQAQWEAVMGRNPSYFKGPDLPVERVSWVDIQEFVKKLTARNDGYRYRLPTEAEWEYAARAGTSDALAGGILREVAWTRIYSDGRTHPVGQMKPNAWGLHDMLGNVGEWVQDGLRSYTGSAATDPTGLVIPGSVGSSGMRGGSWSDSIGSVRVDARTAMDKQGRYGIYDGFRCARER